MDKSLLDHYRILMAVLSYGIICFSAFTKLRICFHSPIDAELLFPRKPTPFSDQSDGSLPFSGFCFTRRGKAAKYLLFVVSPALRSVFPSILESLTRDANDALELLLHALQKVLRKIL